MKISISLSSVLLLSLGSSWSYAQTTGATAPMAGYCLKTASPSSFAITQKKPMGFFRIKTGVFCTTPVVSANGTFVTGCDDSQVRIISPAGLLLHTVKIDHDADAGISSNPEVVAIPGSSPEQFVVTSQVDQLLIRFDLAGNVLAKINVGADAGKAVALSNSSYFMADSSGIGYLYTDLVVEKTAPLVTPATPDAASANVIISPKYSNVEGTLAVSKLLSPESDISNATISDPALLATPTPTPPPPILFDTKASDLNDPSVRVSPLGENQIVMSDSGGHVFVLKESGEIQTIKAGSGLLSNTQVAPDGIVWVSDDAGIVYKINVDTQEVKTLNFKTAKAFTRPVFLKNGKVVLASGSYIYILANSNAEQPEAIYDSSLHSDTFFVGGVKRYIGSMMDNVDLGSVELEDGKEYIFVPTYGGYHLINTLGEVVGVFDYGAGNGDAETFSTPKKLSDGSFAIGMFYGMDRVTIKKSVTPIPSGSWVPCAQ